MSVELFGNGDPRVREALAIRFAVFVDEQHVRREIEIDEHDELDDTDTVHAIVRRGEVAIAAGRFYRRDAETAQIGRMVVVREARRSGTGRAMLDALLDEDLSPWLSSGPPLGADPRDRVLREGRLRDLRRRLRRHGYTTATWAEL